MIQEGSKSEPIPVSAGADLVESARATVLRLYNERADTRLVLHNYSFTLDLLEHLQALAMAEGADERDLLVARLAACFAHTGLRFHYEHPEADSLRLARTWLQEQGVGPGLREDVLACLRQATGKEAPERDDARWLHDAITVNTFLDRADERRPLLHLEWELMLRRKLDKIEWAQFWLQQLFSLRLYTHAARTGYEGALADQIKSLKKTIEKAGATVDQPETPESRRFHAIEKDQPVRGVQTFFRANYRNHINLSSIADNKANIMISVNSILISVLITILTYRDITDSKPIILLPVVIFLVTGLASLIFAVLSARPKVTNVNTHQDPERYKKNIVFFGNFVNLQPQEYERAMNQVFRDKELLYGNMTRDLYNLGKVLDKKYRYLSISYNIFMLGFVATVGSFLVAILF